MDGDSPEESDSLTVSHSPQAPRDGGTLTQASTKLAKERHCRRAGLTCHISPHAWQESHQSRWYASFFRSAMRVSPQRGQAGDLRT